MSLRAEIQKLDDEAALLLEQCRLHDRQYAERAEVVCQSCVQKDFGDFGQIRKIYENPPLRQRPIQPEPEPEHLIVMSAAAQASWNSWCQAHISRALDDMNQAIAEFAVEFVAEKLQPLRDRLDALEEQVAALRSDLIPGGDEISRKYHTIDGVPILRRRNNAPAA
jgi:cell division protein FtsB